MPRPADITLPDRILRAAGTLFYERGVNGVGMADVTEAAGCGKNALYRHFPGKTELVTAYLDAFSASRDRQAAAALEGVEDPAEALVALTREVADRAAREGFNGCAVRNYLRESRTLDDAAGREATAVLARWRERVLALAGRLDVDDPASVGEQVWLVHDGIYGATADPAEAGRIGVRLVQQLVSRPDSP